MTGSTHPGGMANHNYMVTDEQDNNRDGDPDALLEACQLARKGHYSEATQRLADALKAGTCTEPQALDLQARMYAQQGLLLHAESCWRKAQSLDRANPAYDEALTSLRRTQRPFAGLQFAATCAGVIGLMLAAVVMFASLRSTDLRYRHALNQKFDSLQRTLNELDAQTARFQKATDATLPLLARTADLDTVAARAAGLGLAISNNWNEIRLRHERLDSLIERVREEARAEIESVRTRLQVDLAAHHSTITQQQKDIAAVGLNTLGELEQHLSAGDDAHFEAVLSALKMSQDRLADSVVDIRDELRGELDAAFAMQSETLNRMAQAIASLEAARAAEDEKRSTGWHSTAPKRH